MFPSGNFMLRGLGAIRTFRMGVSAITNTVVAPVSAIPCELGINGGVVCTLCAHTVCFDTFEVTTVLSSSSSEVDAIPDTIFAADILGND